ncbi:MULTISPECIES: hypothetical protein [unclassified Saccharopolyspora]|uniref:hypothetical protein n=1 Tax=unclassified Saccharopolyspora TaxID=2646250 RepID=UPI001CD636E0|nr:MULTISPECIES: hypothetical protein [unclassified Saccharopolyspora]MCA1228292.1 hypothetical protein [Saccharopolyspora sp. 6M]MCA1281549.1 hypothetical protein [Saccharopolyspora sp. 7B]
MDFGAVMRALGISGNLTLVSSRELVDKVNRAALRFERKEQKQIFRYRKWPVPVTVPDVLPTAPVHVLREVGVATTFFDDPVFADAARLWAQLRYCATLAPHRGRMTLSATAASSVVHHHKVAQSEYLGIGLALFVARHVLSEQYPGLDFQAVDADVALRSGIPGVGAVRQASGVRVRPDYFLIGHPRNGGAVKIVVLECKGNHGNESLAVDQLAKACVQVRSVEIAGRGCLPSLMVASCLRQSGITVHVLDPPGEDELWSGSADELERELNEELGEVPEPFTSERPGSEQQDDAVDELALFDRTLPVDVEESDTSFPAEARVLKIPQASQKWFSHALARFGAASALLFAGAGRTAATYRPPPPRGGFTGLDEQSSASGDDAATAFDLGGGLHVMGTRSVLPLPDGGRFVVHRGLESGLYEQLAGQRLGSYLRSAPGVEERWRNGIPDEEFARDAVSVGSDGTVLAVSLDRGR